MRKIFLSMLLFTFSAISYAQTNPDGTQYNPDFTIEAEKGKRPLYIDDGSRTSSSNYSSDSHLPSASTPKFLLL